jgi:hypothetical protein
MIAASVRKMEMTSSRDVGMGSREESSSYSSRTTDSARVHVARADVEGGEVPATRCSREPDCEDNQSSWRLYWRSSETSRGPEGIFVRGLGKSTHGDGRVRWRDTRTLGFLAVLLLLIVVAPPCVLGATTGLIGGPTCGVIPTYFERTCGPSGEFLDPEDTGTTEFRWTRCIKKKCESEQLRLDRSGDVPYNVDPLILRVIPDQFVDVGETVTVECKDGHRFGKHPYFIFEAAISAREHYKIWTAQCSGSGDCSLPSRPFCYPMICDAGFTCPANHTCVPEPTPGMQFVHGGQEINVTCPNRMMLRSSEAPECRRWELTSCQEDPDRLNGVVLADGNVEDDAGLVALPDCTPMKCGCNGDCQGLISAALNISAAVHGEERNEVCAEGYRAGAIGTMAACSAGADITVRCNDCIFDGDGRWCVPVGCDTSAARAAPGGAEFSTASTQIGYGTSIKATCPTGFRVGSSDPSAPKSQDLACLANCSLDTFVGCQEVVCPNVVSTIDNVLGTDPNPAPASFTYEQTVTVRGPAQATLRRTELPTDWCSSA